MLAAAETLLAAGSGERKVEQAASAIGALRDVLRDLLVLSAADDAELVVNLDRASEWAEWANQFPAEALVDALYQCLSR